MVVIENGNINANNTTAKTTINAKVTTSTTTCMCVRV